MFAPAPELPHSTGEMDESQAIERMLARSSAGQDPEPLGEDDLLEDRDPGDDEPLDGDHESDEPAVEGGEFSDEDDEPAAASADPVVKFDDGTEMPLSEVKRGFLRQQDYTRKTQETAELRKTLETERSTFAAERKQVADRLTPLIQQARAIVDDPGAQRELAELRVTDPGAYAVRVMELQQKRAQLDQLEWQQNALREQAEAEEAEKFQRERRETAERSRTVLMEKIPAAKKDFASWYRDLGKYVLEQGISAEAWDSEVSHPVILLAWKAMQYDAATRKTPATTEKLRKAPQPMRPGSAKPPGHAQARALREATERAQKSGSVEDAISLQRLKMSAARR